MPMLMPLRDFVSPPGDIIPGDDPPKNTTILPYTLRVGSNGLYFHYDPTHGPPPNDPSGPYKMRDRALDMRIYKDCQVQLSLQSGPFTPKWYFPMCKEVIKLGHSTIGNPTSRYRNLAFGPPINPYTDKCQMLMFDAFHHVEDDPNNPGHLRPNTDEFCIEVHLAQLMADGTTVDTELLVLTIDPGIKNPGDNP